MILTSGTQGKKGTITELLFIAIFILFLAIGSLFMSFTVNRLVANMTANPTINSSVQAKAAFNDMESNFNGMDLFIFSIMIGMFLGMLIASWFIAGNAIFVFIYFLAVGIVTIVSAVFANVWYEIANTTTLTSTVGSLYPLTNHILSNLPYYMAIMGLASIVVMFAKPRGV